MYKGSNLSLKAELTLNRLPKVTSKASLRPKPQKMMLASRLREVVNRELEKQS